MEPDIFQQLTRNTFATEPQYPCCPFWRQRLLNQIIIMESFTFYLKACPCLNLLGHAQGLLWNRYSWCRSRILSDTCAVWMTPPLQQRPAHFLLHLTAPHYLLPYPCLLHFLIQPLPSEAFPHSLSMGTSSASSDIIIVLEINLGSRVFVFCLFLVVCLTRCHDLVHQQIAE